MRGFLFTAVLSALVPFSAAAAENEAAGNPAEEKVEKLDSAVVSASRAGKKTPVTYSMEPVAALVMLMAIYTAAMTGGSISAILLHTPGTPANAATAIEGYPLTLQGRGLEAVGMSMLSSGIGGLASAVALLLIAPPLAKVSLLFSEPESFLIAIFGLTVIGSLAGNSILKGLLMGLVGLFLATVGTDSVTGTLRYTFGSDRLMSGVQMVPALIGLFTIAQVMNNCEDYEHAKARGANILCEVCGYGFSSNGGGISQPSDEGSALAMKRAMTDASIAEEDVDYINAHATSTPQGDMFEAKALSRLFDKKHALISSTKSMTGHECWMAGASELVYSIIMMQNNFVAPNINFMNPDEYSEKLNIATKTIDTELNVILSNSFGFGGTNSALVIKKLNE